MKNFTIIIFLFGFNFAQVINPCEDERFLEISEKYVDQMTEEEFQYFTQKEKECLEYDLNKKSSNKAINNLITHPLKSQLKSSPCEDERFLEISEKYVDQMTEEEFQYFTQKEKECLEYKNGTSPQSYFQKQKNNEKSLTSDKVINLWPAIFLIAIIFLR